VLSIIRGFENRITVADDLKSLTREALYDLVWSEPMLKVAGRFVVSSSYLA